MNTFIQWVIQQELEGPTATSKTIKTKQDRNRLHRMETMLEELMRLKELVGRRTDYANV